MAGRAVITQFRRLLLASWRRGERVFLRNGRLEPTLSEGGSDSQLLKNLRNVRYRTDQMTAVEYGIVTGIIMAKAPCRLLVFGLGRDSELWTEVNKGGDCVFLEDVAEWFHQPQGGVAFLVKYPGCELPPEVAAKQYDVILVDGPMSFKPEHPGRGESISIAAKFVAPGGVVMVHDYNRPQEQKWCGELLGTPSYWVDRLAVFCSRK